MSTPTGNPIKQYLEIQIRDYEGAWKPVPHLSIYPTSDYRGAADELEFVRASYPFQEFRLVSIAITLLDGKGTVNG